MMIETKNRIDEVIAELKDGNSLFPDHVYLLDPEDEAGSFSFSGITDAIPNFIYITRDGFDDVMIPDQFQAGKFWARSSWKLIGKVAGYEKTNLLEFCVNRVNRIGGCNVVSFSNNSEVIYFEETDDELRDKMTLIRVSFTVSTLISWCKKTIDLCADGNC